MDSTVNVQSDTKKDYNMIGDMIENKNKKRTLSDGRKKKACYQNIFNSL